MSDQFSPAWEDVTAWEARGVSPASTLAMEHLKIAQEAMADNPGGGPTCIVYDEDLAEATLVANNNPELFMEAADAPEVMKDTDAFARQNDKGPYHWAQGPQDVHPLTAVTPAPPPPPPTPPVTPSPNPQPATPGTLPRKAKTVTTTNLRLRIKAGVENAAKGVLATGTEAFLTGGRKIVAGVMWVRVRVETAEILDKTLAAPDRWIAAPPKQYGWVNSEYLAVPASEYVAKDFPNITHEYLWFMDDAGGLNADDVRRTLTAISDDPRGPRRAGIALREAPDAASADVLIRFTPGPCSGAAGCYYKASGQKARVDIDPKWFNTAWLSRVFLHETFGHATCRSYDHYSTAPQYPRSDYYGLMGNWQDQYGDHAWPDEDDITNFVEWKEGRSSVVFVRDVP